MKDVGTKDLYERAGDLARLVEQATNKLDIKSAAKKLEGLKAESIKPDFWDDNLNAQASMKQITKLESKVMPWQQLKKSIQEILELASMNDESLRADLEKQLEALEQNYGELKKELSFSGPYDGNDVILSIYSGAGGTDAQDWAQMLSRMYLRWAEQNNVEAKVVDESAGDEAGIKNITLELAGGYLYGKLKGEHGVHRLVRLSPFNSDNLRQTSFAKVDILPKVEEPEQVEIDEKALRVDVYRSGGKGGQSVNTTDSAVRITHLPTGIAVAIQNERSQLQNKETAMTILRSKLAQLQIEQHAEKISELKGPNQSAEWGNQIRSYVLHPYKQVKDLRTRHESSDPDAVLNGNLNDFIQSYLDYSLK